MNLNTKFELGNFVQSAISGYDSIPKKMQVVRIQIFMDGGYQYNCSWWNEGEIMAAWFFERELEECDGV